MGTLRWITRWGDKEEVEDNMELGEEDKKPKRQWVERGRRNRGVESVEQEEEEKGTTAMVCADRNLMSTNSILKSNVHWAI